MKADAAPDPVFPCFLAKGKRGGGGGGGGGGGVKGGGV